MQDLPQTPCVRGSVSWHVPSYQFSKFWLREAFYKWLFVRMRIYFLKQFEMCISGQVIQAYHAKCIRNWIAYFLGFPITKKVTKWPKWFFQNSAYIRWCNNLQLYTGRGFCLRQLFLMACFKTSENASFEACPLWALSSCGPTAKSWGNLGFNVTSWIHGDHSCRWLFGLGWPLPEARTQVRVTCLFLP